MQIPETIIEELRTSMLAFPSVVKSLTGVSIDGALNKSDIERMREVRDTLLTQLGRLPTAQEVVE